MKIAFFDSGIGGLTVLNQAIRKFPDVDFIYFADSHYAPYGSKSQREVELLIFDSIDFLAAQNIDALVLACHTASKMMLEKLRSRYPFPIIGMHSGLVASNSIGTLHAKLICTTDLSKKIWQQYLTEKPINAHFISLQKLVVFAENREFNTPEVYRYLAGKFADVDWSQFDCLVLGCTHFPFFKNQLRKIIPDYIKIVDGSRATALQLKNLVSSTAQFRGSGKINIDYYISKTKRNASFFTQYFQALEPMDWPLQKMDITIDKSNYSFMKNSLFKNSLSV